MASITSTGIGSGLDISGLVQQLVAAEGAPVEARLAGREARAQAKLSAFGSLKSALSEFNDKLDVMKDVTKFLARKASSGNEDLFTVTASETALPASYSIEVAQLAQAQKLTSGAFTDPDTVIGTGTLHITVGTETFNVEITNENNTVSGIRDAINAAIDNKGVAVTIVNADAGSHLIFTGEKTGASHNMTITQSGGDGGLAALEYDPGGGLNSLTEVTAGQDALIRIDGFDVMSESNSVTGVIGGVTIDLLAAGVGAPTTLVVENDHDAVKQYVNDFIESYNGLVETLDELTTYDAENDVAAALLGDASIRSMRDQMRREFSTAVTDLDAPFSTLPEVGIALDLNGKLSLDDAALTTVLDSDFSKFGQLFANSDGFAVRLYDLTDSYLKSDGIIATRTEGLDNTIEDFADQRERLNERLVALEARLLNQFNALDSLLGQLQTTSSFLTGQLASLPGFTSPDDS